MKPQAMVAEGRSSHTSFAAAQTFSGSAILLSFFFLGAITSFVVAATDATLVLQQ
jgi:hypothetical protein